MPQSFSSVFGTLILSFLLVAVSCSDLNITKSHLEDEKEVKEFNPKIWEAPPYLQKAFPYYISGLDLKGQPVFVVEYGKWDMRKYFEEGGDEQKALLYLDQMFYRFSAADTILPTEKIENSTGQFGLIVDLDGYDERQHHYGPSLYFILTCARKFSAVAKTKLDYNIVVNVNKAGEFLCNNLFAPILGDSFAKVEAGGLRRETWEPLLLKRIPKESLALWYSGSASPFRPIAIYGWQKTGTINITKIQPHSM